MIFNVYEMLVPGVTFALGPTLVICKSALPAIGVVAVLEEFTASGSGVLLVTLAVFRIGSAPRTAVT